MDTAHWLKMEKAVFAVSFSSTSIVKDRAVYCRVPALGGYGQHLHIWMLGKEWLDYVENKKIGL